jgi:hypothetical protein
MSIKKLYKFLLFFLLAQSLQADEYDDPSDFRVLTPEQQVHTLIREYRYERYWNSITLFSRARILTENTAVVKPLLFTYFKEINSILPDTDPDTLDWAFEIVQYILYDLFYGEGLLTKDEEEQLAVLYEERIDLSLRKYKQVDLIIFWYEIVIGIIRTKEHIGQTRPNYKREIFEKYTNLGYEDLAFYP